jgi:hypothetical protein
MKKCKGTTKSGTPCQANAGPGGLCFFHANPDRAKTLGQIGGRKNAKFTGVELDVPDNMSAADLSNLTGDAIRLVLSGDLQAREAVALSHLISCQHRVIATADIERRISRLEAQTAAQLEQESLDPAPSGTAEMQTAGDVEPGSEKLKTAEIKSYSIERSDPGCESEEAIGWEEDAKP